MRDHNLADESESEARQLAEDAAVNKALAGLLAGWEAAWAESDAWLEDQAKGKDAK